jgi:hypothetical protein
MADFEVDKPGDTELQGLRARIGGFHDRLRSSQPSLTEACCATQGSGLATAKACLYARSIVPPLRDKYGATRVHGPRRDHRPTDVSDRIEGELQQLVSAFNRDTGSYASEMKRCLEQQGLSDGNRSDNASRRAGSDCRQSRQSGGHRPHR